MTSTPSSKSGNDIMNGYGARHNRDAVTIAEHNRIAVEARRDYKLSTGKNGDSSCFSIENRACANDGIVIRLRIFRSTFWPAS